MLQTSENQTLLISSSHSLGRTRVPSLRRYSNISSGIYMQERRCHYSLTLTVSDRELKTHRQDFRSKRDLLENPVPLRKGAGQNRRIIHECCFSTTVTCYICNQGLIAKCKYCNLFHHCITFVLVFHRGFNDLFIAFPLKLRPK